MRRMLALIAGITILFPTLAAAQAYPERAVRMVVPFSPGGGTDIIARLLGQKLSEKFGQTFVVENKTGANGNIGAQAVAQAKPDGYTILVSTSALTINPSLNENVGYNLTKDFTPVMLVASSPFLVLVNPKVVQASTLDEFIAFAKSKDGGLSWASTSEGNAEHLAGSLLQSMGGFKMNHIPYKGGAEAVKDVLGGHVGVGVVSLPTSLAYLTSGQLKAIAVTTTRRVPQIPEVPTVAEAGISGFELPTWYAVWVPAGTPADIVDKIHGGLAEALKMDDVRKRVIAIGFDPGGGSRAEFTDYVTKEAGKYGNLIAQIGLKKQ